MITPNDLLTASDEELPKMLGEVLQPEKNKHSNIASSKQKSQECKRGKFDSDQVFDQHTCDDCTYVCRKCYKRVSWTEHQHGSCPVCDPIPLTWPEAMKWRDWAVEEYGQDDEGDTFFVKAMTTVYYLFGLDYGITAWLTDIAKPKHYLIPAATCKLKLDKQLKE